MDESEAKNSNCKIIVDAMGGDYAPQNAVVGAIDAYNEKKDFELFLIGKKDEILSVIKSELFVCITVSFLFGISN